ncbi:PDZ domain-containing protein [Luteolibacter ambystomatis]|uniref:PDZ domain-containing protein n=1 Tax=Luteolibacter ambystomatis TaxID=2824561 RepID=A0A975IXX6_9BACT|nr:PDZ domain-containing protein [Luteolibacter ambystomatis]QUE49544.1 PDZ domain-containing protein [Luteolibacter ambystomatis]
MVRTAISRLARCGIGFFFLSAGLHPACAQVAKWEVVFPAAAGGVPAKSIATPLEEGGMLVAVALPGTDATRPGATRAGQPVQAEVVGMDSVSRLCFLKTPLASDRLAWAKTAPYTPGTPLHAPGPVKARATGWVKQIGTKVLPFALLRINFEGAVPPTGTPVSTDDGRVVALVYQSAGNGDSAYAIPVEAVQRVKADVCGGGKLARGWLGLSLRAESPSPQVMRVTPDSPASKADIRPNDVLLQVGTRQVANYADAANAFFYLIPREPVDLKLLRGTQEISVTVSPVPAPSGK